MELPGSSLRLFTVFGIDIEINVTWIVIFVLLTSALSLVYFPSQFPGRSGYLYFAIGSVTAVLFFSSVLFHELSHSLVAIRNKLPIKKITLFIFGGVSQMTEEPQTPGIEFKMASAGPLSSFFLAFFFGILWSLGRYLNMEFYITAPLQYLAAINFLLAVFNLVPGFPLDGGRILRSILWHFTHSLYRATSIASKAGQVVAFSLIGGGLLLLVTGSFAGLWFMLIGWFLEQAALNSFQNVRLQTKLSDVKVSTIMTPEVIRMPANISLKEAIDDYFLTYRHARFPVEHNGELIGVITLNDIRSVARENWERMPVKAVLHPATKEGAIAENDTALQAINQMARQERGHLLVMKDDMLLGIITRTDILKVLQFKEELDV